MTPSLNTSAIGRDPVFYARAVITKILTVAKPLDAFPKVGRKVPELGDKNIRERFAYSYRLIYRIEPARVLVAAVVHDERLLELLSARFP
ncbi:MAG: type II toxin-antitoxin system RelE/ParE family toxin [Gammaproteobacteria bacterium]